MENLTGNQIRNHFLKGSFYLFSIQIVLRILNMIKLFVIARILSPGDFGLIGIALLVFAVFTVFTDTGFADALIRMKENVAPYLDAAWTLLVIRGVVVAGAIWGSAPAVSAFLNAPESKLIIQVVSVSFLIRSLENIHIVLFFKKLQFRKVFVYSVVSGLADFLVTLFLIFTLRNIWALVFGFIAADFIKTIISYVVHPYKPKLVFSWRRIKELFQFGKWITGSKIVSYFLTQGDDLFVAKLLGAVRLGYYQMAYKISNLPTTEITHVISKVSFPIFSNLQDEPEKLRETYLYILKVIVFLSFPFAGLLISMSLPFTELVLGAKWLPIVTPIRILCVYGVIRSIGATTGPVFKTVNRPDYITKIQLLKLVILLILIYPFTVKWGIAGAAMVITINAVLVNPIADYILIRTIGLDPVKFIKTIAIPAFSAVGMMGVLYVLQRFAAGGAGLLNLFLLAGAGIISYLGLYGFSAFLTGDKTVTVGTGELSGFVRGLIPRK